MNQNCQVTFDDNRRSMTVKFVVNHVKTQLVVSYDDVIRGRVPCMAGHKAHKFSYEDFKKASAALAKTFRPEYQASCGIQFCKELAVASDALYRIQNSRNLSPDEYKALKAEIARLGQDFLKAADIPANVYTQAVTVGYCTGVDTLFCTSDYLSVRRGDQIIARIDLPGNDYNDLRNFLLQAGEDVLSSGNIENMKAAVKQMKMDEATRLVNSERPARTWRRRSVFDNENF